MSYMSSTATRQTVDCICGRRHRNGGIWVTAFGIEHGCSVKAAIEAEQELRSAKGIARRAAEFREEAEARVAWAAQQPVGPRQDRHLREAARNYQLAYELEN
jgi:hypothetical protein